MCKAIVSCAVLHNFLLLKESVDEADIVIDPPDAIEENTQGAVSEDALKKRFDIAAALQ